MTSFEVSDIATYLMGTWRLNLEVRTFNGKFDRIRPHNGFLVLDEALGAISEPGTRVLNWKQMNENMIEDTSFPLRICTQVLVMHDGRTLFEWVENGHVCTGTYDPSTLSITLMSNSPGKAVTYTYQIIDQHTMSVCVVMTIANSPPNIKFGNLLRVHK
mmetsp:Transcript_4927/g.6301  ORF Transcript_4927/g.6301 Transcript_4927/m.6301 type:complete len:159 (+) Transcript_4927:75-551(+)